MNKKVSQIISQTRNCFPFPTDFSPVCNLSKRFRQPIQIEKNNFIGVCLVFHVVFIFIYLFIFFICFALMNTNRPHT